MKKFIKFTKISICLFVSFLGSCEISPTEGGRNIQSSNGPDMINQIMELDIQEISELKKSKKSVFVQFRSRDRIDFYIAGELLSGDSVFRWEKVTEEEWSNRLLKENRAGGLLVVSLVANLKAHVSINGQDYDVNLSNGSYVRTASCVDS